MTTKLIRLDMDKGGPIPEHLTKSPIYDLDIIRALLGAKLHEEAAEVASAIGREEVLKELGDAFECLLAIAATYELAGTDIIMQAEIKRLNRGALVGFDAERRLFAILQRPRA